jgi:hypothetical protein
MRSSLFGFLLKLAGLLVVTFTLWHVTASMLAAPASVLSALLLEFWLPGLVDQAYLEGTRFIVIAAIGEADGQLMSATLAGNQLQLSNDTRLLSYSIPFYAALHFATPMESTIERFTRGLLCLWGLLVIGIIAVVLKDMMLTFGQLMYLRGTLLPSPAIIALAYQFSVLIIPPVAPILLWGFQVRQNPLLGKILGDVTTLLEQR